MLKNVYRPSCEQCQKPMVRNGFRYNKTYKAYMTQYACLPCKKWRLKREEEKSVICPTCNSQVVMRINADDKSVLVLDNK